MLNQKVLVGCLVFCVVVFLLYAVIITVLYAKDVAKSCEIKAKQKTKCETYSCVQAAAQIVSYIDESIDPCEDFYKFANGLYVKAMTDETEYYESDSFYSTVSKLMNNKIGALLSEPSQHDEWRAIGLAKTFYQSCLAQSTIVSHDNQVLINILDSFGGWPAVKGSSWLSRKFDLIKLIGGVGVWGFDTNSIFTLNVSVYPKNTTNRWLEIDEGNYQNIEKSNKEYKEKMLETPTYFISGKDEASRKKTINTEMKRVATFEEQLSNYYIYENHSENRDKREAEESNSENDYDNSDFDDEDNVSNPTTTINELQQSYPYLNWLDYINAVLPRGLYVSESEPVINKNPSFFEKLGVILEKTSNRTLANYIIWRAIYQAYQMEAEKSGKALRNYYIDLTSRKFSIPVTLLYSRKYFNETSRQAVISLVEDVRHAFDMLGEVNWMDNKTRTKAIEKAENIVAHVGYPEGIIQSHVLHEYYGQLEAMEPDNFFQNSLNWNLFNNNQMFNSLRKPANRSGWETTIDLTPNKANAFYSRDTNTMQFPIAILHEKFFTVDRPHYINYASLGNTVGHEIIHGFDSAGGYYDLNGNEITWWDDETKDKFNENAECFVDQYSSYTDAKTELQVDGKKTLNENIADNGGTKAAYYAYQNWIKRNGPEKLVPGIKYNQNQLFWISYAQAESGVFGEYYLIDQIIEDVHAPGEFRVNGVVSNAQEFAKDFKCAVGTKMNPVKKCKIW